MLNFLQNIRHFSGLMGDFSVQLSYGRRRGVSFWKSEQEVSASFYVSYGDEDVGILYGVLWIEDQAVVIQTCGKVSKEMLCPSIPFPTNIYIPATGLCNVVRLEGRSNVGDGRVGERLRYIR